MNDKHNEDDKHHNEDDKHHNEDDKLTNEGTQGDVAKMKWSEKDGGHFSSIDHPHYEGRKVELQKIEPEKVWDHFWLREYLEVTEDLKGISKDDLRMNKLKSLESEHPAFMHNYYISFHE